MTPTRLPGLTDNGISGRRFSYNFFCKNKQRQKKQHKIIWKRHTQTRRKNDIFPYENPGRIYTYFRVAFYKNITNPNWHQKNNRIRLTQPNGISRTHQIQNFGPRQNQKKCNPSEAQKHTTTHSTIQRLTSQTKIIKFKTYGNTTHRSKSKLIFSIQKKSKTNPDPKPT